MLSPIDGWPTRETGILRGADDCGMSATVSCEHMFLSLFSSDHSGECLHREDNPSTTQDMVQQWTSRRHRRRHRRHPNGVHLGCDRHSRLDHTSSRCSLLLHSQSDVGFLGFLGCLGVLGVLGCNHGMGPCLAPSSRNLILQHRSRFVPFHHMFRILCFESLLALLGVRFVRFLSLP